MVGFSLLWLDKIRASSSLRCMTILLLILLLLLLVVGIALFLSARSATQETVNPQPQVHQPITLPSKVNRKGTSVSKPVSVRTSSRQDDKPTADDGSMIWFAAIADSSPSEASSSHSSSSHYGHDCSSSSSYDHSSSSHDCGSSDF